MIKQYYYKIAQKIDLNGYADKAGFESQDADPEQLEMGIEVEMEHTDDPKVAEKISMDHLAEIKDYYTRLEHMESEALRGE